MGADGIRVNMLHPNAVFDTGIWTDEVLQSRADNYGMTIDEYKRNNILHTDITSHDVTSGFSMRAMTRSLPPHLGQVSMSMAKTRFRRRIQVMGARGLSGFSWRGLRFGTTDSRCLQFGANTPWNRVMFNRGRGTNAARRAMKSSGSRTTWVEPSRNGCLNR